MDAIGLLAGGVAHDFNNILMVIRSYAELMQDSIGPEHRLYRNVQEILSAARRAADLNPATAGLRTKTDAVVAGARPECDRTGHLEDVTQVAGRRR
jgi:signal transduction histidine kinase